MAQNDLEHRRTRRLLRALIDLAKESSMTGSLEKGARLGIRHYNSMLEHLEGEGVVPGDLFHRLDENVDKFDELGVACSLLESYLGDEEEGQSLVKSTFFAPHAPDSQEVKELRELAELLRERLPELRRSS